MIIDDLREIIHLARGLQAKIEKSSLADNKDAILEVLRIIENLDLRQQYSIQRKDLPKGVHRKSKLIYKLAQRAIREIQEKNYVPANIIAILEQIIGLENEISTELTLLPTRTIRTILKYSPGEARSHGYFFRGVSESDYERVMEGKPLFAPKPNGNITITDHIINQQKSSESQFISLTSDAKTAEIFGKVLVLSREHLRGHLYTPAEIEADLRRRAGKIKWTQPLRLQRKNAEFLLGPSTRDIAVITLQSVINVRKLAA